MGAQFLSMLIGAWLMAAPAVLGYGDPARASDRIVGPLVFTFGCTAMFEATRNVRWVNTALGAWLVLAPFVLGYAGIPLANSLGAGAMLVLLSLVRGTIRGEYGGGWSSLWSHGSTTPRGP
jgi:hypothetical protein